MNNGISGENEIVQNVELNGWMKGRLLSWTRIWCGLWRRTWISDALVMLWSSVCILDWRSSYLELLSNNLEYLSKHVVDNSRQSNWMLFCWIADCLLREWLMCYGGKVIVALDEAWVLLVKKGRRRLGPDGHAHRVGIISIVSGYSFSSLLIANNSLSSLNRVRRVPGLFLITVATPFHHP